MARSCADGQAAVMMLRLRSETGATPDDEPTLVLEAIVRCENGRRDRPGAALVRKGCSGQIAPRAH